MANQMPVKDPVDLIYTGGQRANAIVGPVTNNGYPAKIGEAQPVEKADVDGLLATGLWARPIAEHGDVGLVTVRVTDGPKKPAAKRPPTPAKKSSKESE